MANKVITHMSAYPMQSKPMGLDDKGMPVFDRSVGSALLRDINKAKMSDGIFIEPADSLKVNAKGGMTVEANVGWGVCNGVDFMLYPTNVRTVAIEPSDPLTARNDRIVVQWNLRNEGTIDDRRVALVCKKGNQTLQRDTDVWELGIADINVRAGTTVINQADITDLRLNTDYCGMVTGRPNQPLDLTSIFNQYTAALNALIANETRRYEEFTEYQTGRINDFDEYQAGRISGLDSEYEAFRSLIASLETQSFTLINNNFDDWSTKRGCTFRTEFPAGSIRSTITVDVSGMLLAEKLTTFPEGSIVTVINFYPWTLVEGGNTVNTTRFTVTKTTSFPSGTIESRVI